MTHIYTFALGPLQLVLMLYSVSAWWLLSWEYDGRRSWRHGSGQLGRLRFSW